MEKKITKIADLIGIIRTAKAGGQFVTLSGCHKEKFNQFPNEEFCKANGITLASGKGSKALNEQFRYNGNEYEFHFKVEFHFGQDYDRSLAKIGLTRSANGSVNEIDHFGGIAMGYPSTHNVCLIYMQGCYFADGHYLNGVKVTDDKEIAYIKGYKGVAKANPLQYRTLGVRNVRSLTMQGTTYIVDIKDISDKEYKALLALYKEPATKVAKAD